METLRLVAFIILLPWRVSCQDLFVASDAEVIEKLQWKKGGARDIINTSNGFLAHSNKALSTSTVYTIAVKTKANLCLDLATGHGTNTLQLWECNGLENQLWNFDYGSYQITWGGNPNMCIDSGKDLKPGTSLYLTNCDGLSPQRWGYDETTGAIYLTNSAADASLCMDLSGGKFDLGTAVELWNCNGLDGQHWLLSHGINIRALANYNYCLDMAGGKTDDGTPIQLWDCNGLANQKWIWDTGSFNVKSAKDPSKCIDAGNDHKQGNGLMLWDCNGSPQQKWGFDDKMQTIWLYDSMIESTANSSNLTSGRPFASSCVDVQNGEMKAGTPVQLWSCNTCWNQQFQVVGPAPTQMPLESSMSGASPSLRGQMQGGCPPKPSPPPSPAPGPAAKVLPHCDPKAASQHGWPQFTTQADLLKSVTWSKYFKTVYGEVPTTGYPICTFTLTHLYQPLLAQANLVPGKGLPTMSTCCPTTTGQYYSTMTDHQNTWSTWIWNTNLAEPEPTGSGLPADTWVEIIHQAYSMDGDATWMYYSPGTAIWFKLGNTKYWADHDNAVLELLKQKCMAGHGWRADQHQCIPQFPQLYKAAIAAGLNSMQFLKHGDMPCGKEKKRQNMAIEIVDLGGPGTTSCGKSFGAATSGVSRYRAGWMAKNTCTCDNKQKTVNCNGYGMNYAKR